MPAVVTLSDVELRDGVLEVELALPAERSFHGAVWRLQDDQNYESFFLRPHQVGNPDAIQYTPVFNGISAWQLYHGEGFWNNVVFPVGEWLRLRVAFADSVAEVRINDDVVLVSDLRRPPASGRIGLLVGGEALLCSELSYDLKRPLLSAVPRERREPGAAVLQWMISDPFAEKSLPGPLLEAAFVSQRVWTALRAEPSGLVDLARAGGLADGRNTVLARVTLRSDREQRVQLELGFSDRATVFLNGAAIFRGDDAYRSRDYRFLGSIGWFDTLYLPLDEGDNEVVVAVSEDFGGWGLQARLREATGVSVIA